MIIEAIGEEIVVQGDISKDKARRNLEKKQWREEALLDWTNHLQKTKNMDIYYIWFNIFGYMRTLENMQSIF